jgi:hypothetical protein
MKVRKTRNSHKKISEKFPFSTIIENALNILNRENIVQEDGNMNKIFNLI